MSLLDLIFPKSCLNCKKPGKYVCEICLSKAKKAQGICPTCDKASIDGFTHVKCKKKYGLDGLVSVWEYEGVIRKAIIGLKYKYATEIVNELASFMVTELQSREVLVPYGYYLVPVPMHWFRENTRGFNQSLDLGSQIAYRMNWKFVPDLLVRKKLNTLKPSSGERKEGRILKEFFL